MATASFLRHLPGRVVCCSAQLLAKQIRTFHEEHSPIVDQTAVESRQRRKRPQVADIVILHIIVVADKERCRGVQAVGDQDIAVDLLGLFQRGQGRINDKGVILHSKP
jgi:hypothetical protein